MKAIPIRFALAATALATVSILALAGVWLLGGDNLAGANPVYTVGIDLDTSGNGVSEVGTSDLCLSKSAGDKFDVDIWAGTFWPEETLGSFDYSLNFDDTRLKINAQNHLMLLTLQEGSVVSDMSDAVPDVTSPHYVTATDYTAPEPGDTQGVLGRYEVEVLADAPSGLAWLSPTDVVLRDGTGSPLTILAVTSAIVAVDVPCPTPFPLTPSLTPPPSPSPSPPPMPLSTLTPSPGPAPTLTPVPSPTPEAEPSPMPTSTPTPAPAAARVIALPPTGAGSASGSSWPWWSLVVAGAVAGAGAMLLAYRGLGAKPH
jgi:hypothetical protein